jgi:hypothetical protein
VSQVSAASADSGFQNWIEKKPFESAELADIFQNNQDVRRKGPELTALSGLSNVWCTSFMVNDTLAVLHFVLTSSAAVYAV